MAWVSQRAVGQSLPAAGASLEQPEGRNGQLGHDAVGRVVRDDGFHAARSQRVHDEARHRADPATARARSWRRGRAVPFGRNGHRCDPATPHADHGRTGPSRAARASMWTVRPAIRARAPGSPVLGLSQQVRGQVAARPRVRPCCLVTVGCAGDPRRGRLEQRHVHERHPDFHRMRHAGPVGVGQQLVAHVPAHLQRAHRQTIASLPSEFARKTPPAARWFEDRSSPRAPCPGPSGAAAPTACAGRAEAGRRRPGCRRIRAARRTWATSRGARAARRGAARRRPGRARAPAGRPAAPASAPRENSGTSRTTRRRRAPTAPP